MQVVIAPTKFWLPSSTSAGPNRICFSEPVAPTLMRVPRGRLACGVAIPQWYPQPGATGDRKSTRLNSSHQIISYAVFCLKKKITHVFKTRDIERVEQEPLTAENETRHWLVSKIPMWADGGIDLTHVIALGEDITAPVDAN